MLQLQPPELGEQPRLAVLDGRDGSARYTPSMGNQTIHGNVFVRDITGDARPEIIYLGYTPMRLVPYTVGADGEFTALYEVPLPAIPGAGSELVGDVDADGAPELVFQIDKDVQVRDARTGALETSIVGGLRGLADLDGDGAPEILIDPAGTALSIHGSDGAGGIAQRSIARGVGFANSRNPWYDDKSSRASGNAARPDPGVLRTYPLAEETLVGQLLLTRSRSTEALVAFDTTGARLRELWRLPIEGGGTFGVVGLADVDGDGATEGVVALGDGSLLVVDAAGQVRARFRVGDRLVTPLVVALDGPDDRALLLEGRDVSSSQADVGPLVVARLRDPQLRATPLGTGSFRFTPAAEPRLARIGGAEALLVSRAREASVLELDGTLRWTTPSCPGDVLQNFGVFDSTGDGRPQVFVSLLYGGIMAFDGDRGALTWAQQDAEGYLPAVTDLDADGGDDLAYITTRQHVRALRGTDGASLFDYSRAELSANGLMMAGDLDGDGEDDLVSSGNYATMAFSRDGTTRWSGLCTEANKDHPGTLVDADADGAEEVIQPTNHGLYCYDGRTGAVLWSYQRPTHVAFTGAVAADLDGDGMLDVLVGAGDGSLLLLDAATGAERWRLDLGSRPGNPVVADVDGDGEAEILVAVAGELRVLDRDVGPQLELDERDLHVSDAFPAAGELLTVDLSVRNTGGAAVRGAAVSFSVDGVPVGAREIDVPPGGATPVSFTWRATGGDHALEVRVEQAAACRHLLVR